MAADHGGGPPAQYECTFSQASSRVDGFVGIAGPYDLCVGYEGLDGRDHLQEHEPRLCEMLRGTGDCIPNCGCGSSIGADDAVLPVENPAAFEAVPAEAGYDVALVVHAGGHSGASDDLKVETVMELLAK